MSRFLCGLGSVLFALSLVACGTGDVNPNGVEAIDCTQDDAFELTAAFPASLALSVQDRTFMLKQVDPLRPEGAFVTKVLSPAPRCGEPDVEAFRMWTVSQYTRWGHGISVVGVPTSAAEWEGIAFWAKAVIDLDPADDPIDLTGDGFEAPRMLTDPNDPNNTYPESAAEYFARKPRRISTSGSVRITISTSHTNSSEFCDATAPPDDPPPLQVQDGSGDCYDSFSSVVNPPARWKFYALPFNEMRQSGWGKPAWFLDAADLTGTTVTLGPFADYDVLIDDVAFFRRRRAAH